MATYNLKTVESKDCGHSLHPMLATGRLSNFEEDLMKRMLATEEEFIKDLFKSIMMNDNPTQKDWDKCSIGLVEGNPDRKYLIYNNRERAIIERTTQIVDFEIKIEYTHRLL